MSDEHRENCHHMAAQQIMDQILAFLTRCDATDEDRESIIQRLSELLMDENMRLQTTLWRKREWTWIPAPETLADDDLLRALGPKST